jgi:cardiolipin synthase
VITNIVLVILSVLCTTIFFLLKQRRRVPNLHLDIDGLPPIEEGVCLLAGLTNGTVFAGNRATVYQNGRVFEELKSRIKSAQHTVHLESFVWSAGDLEKEFVEVLSERTKAGIQVRVLLDAVGAMDGSEEAFAALKQAGVDLHFYCRPHWWNLRRFNHRTHRKLLIVDGTFAYAGGHGIADLWMGDGEDEKHYRDTGICLEGPAVAALQAVFMENWIEETKSVPTGPACFPKPEPQGDVSVHVVSSATGDAVSSVALLYTLAIASAKREVIIQNPYFAPEVNVAKLLCTMVQRGVSVHLMVPGVITDSPVVRSAGMALYDSMLAAGVRIYEFCPTLLHQKIVIVDGIWSHVGSTNFDARALALNEEVGVGILDATIAKQLRDAYEEDLQRSEEIHLENWRKRRWYQKAYSSAVYLLRDQM